MSWGGRHGHLVLVLNDAEYCSVTRNPTIIINTGVGDPVAIGTEVAGVLNAYGAKTGGVPVVTKKPKAKPKQRPKKSKTG